LIACALIGLQCGGASDPPGDGLIRLDLDRVALRPGFTAADFTVQQVLLFYDAIQKLGSDICTAGKVVPVPQTAVHLDLSNPGRTFVASFPASPGNLVEIRLVVRNATLTKDGKSVPVETRIECPSARDSKHRDGGAKDSAVGHDDLGDDDDENRGDAGKDDELGVLAGLEPAKKRVREEVEA